MTPKNIEPAADGVNGAEVAELKTVGNIPVADPREPLTEEPKHTAPASELPSQDQENDVRPFVESQSSANGVPTIAVQRQATLTAENVASIPRSPSIGSLTPRLSRDNSQTSQSSLRSRADSKGSSSTGHWLKEQLENAGFECPKHHYYFLISKRAQQELIPITNVARDLQAREPHIDDHESTDYARTICTCANRLYATLAYIKKGSFIKGLLAEGIKDDDLPFVRKPNDKSKFALRRKNGGPIKTFDTWTDKHLQKFDRYQWWMSAPVFKLNEETYELHDKTILPFIFFEPPEGIEGKKQGGYSEVYPVRVHPAHHEFWESSGSVVRIN